MGVINFIMKKKKLNLKDLNPSSNKEHNHDHSNQSNNFKKYFPAIISFTMLIIGIALDYFKVLFFNDWQRIIWYGVAYLPVGFPVVKAGWKNIKKGDVFTEFFLMSIATIGAFVIGEFPEGVAVMLFYAVGELFQAAAVNKAKGNIKALLDVRPKEALVYRNNDYVSVNPEEVEIGEKVKVRVGEKIPLDGILLSEKGSFNTAALTGESKPDTISKSEKVFAGSINMDGVIEIETTKEFKDSSISRILHMVQNATARKSKTELFIRKFARIYTPIVVYLAIAITFLPYFFVDDYVFRDWLYRALIFLVISCPCALVISIPLGYFGGLGAASKNGILFKGASFLDAMTKINTLIMDKTGTVTKGVFKIKEIKAINWEEKEFMKYLMAMEEQSTHPIAKAILEYKADGEVYYGTQRSRPPWDVDFAELWELKKTDDSWVQHVRLGSWDAMPVSVAQDSEIGKVTAELVDIGSGTSEEDYAGKNLAGRLVLTSSQPGAVVPLAVKRYGAAGIISYAANQRTAWWKENENLVRWGHLNTFSDTPAFAFMVSLKQARAFQQRLLRGKYYDYDVHYMLRDNWQETSSPDFAYRIKLTMPY